MIFKFVVLALTLAYANAGNLIAQPSAVHYSSAPAVSSSYFQQASAPVAYAAKTYAAPAVAAVHASPAYAYHAAPQAVAVHAPSVGLSQESLARSLGGAQSVSSYSKAVDSAFSSVRKYDTRITNDALSYAPAQVAYSSPLVTNHYAASAPVAYGSPAPVAYAAHAPVAYAKTYAAPAQVVSYNAPAPVAYAKSYAAPAQVVSYGAPAPVAYAKSYAAPAQVVSYGAPAPVAYAKSYAAPAQVVSYGAPAPVAYAKTYAAPAQVVSYNSAPVLTKTYAAPAPVVSYGAPAPVYAKTVSPVAAYAAHSPVQYSAGPAVLATKAAVAYSPAVGVAHTTFQGYGIEYHY